MAALSDADRALLHAQIQAEVSNERESTAGSKADWRVLINALDNYLNINAAAINTSIPQPQRGTFTAREKARAMVYVIRKRFLAGS